MGQAPGDDSALLVQGVARGDRDALARLYDRFGTLVFTVSLHLLRARAEAEDLLQEVFLQVWRQASAYDPERGSPEAWLLTIARSRGIDKLRSMRRSDERIRPTEDVRPTPDVGVASGADPSEGGESSEGRDLRVHVRCIARRSEAPLHALPHLT